MTIFDDYVFIHLGSSTKEEVLLGLQQQAPDHFNKDDPDLDVIPPRPLVLTVRNRRSGDKAILVLHSSGEPVIWSKHLSLHTAQVISGEFVRVHLSNCCSKHGCYFVEYQPDIHECPVVAGHAEPIHDKCEYCLEDEVYDRRQEELVDSFSVLTDEVHESKKVSVSFADEHVLVDPATARKWAADLRLAAFRAESKSPQAVELHDDGLTFLEQLLVIAYSKYLEYSPPEQVSSYVTDFNLNEIQRVFEEARLVKTSLEVWAQTPQAEAELRRVSQQAQEEAEERAADRRVDRKLLDEKVGPR